MAGNMATPRSQQVRSRRTQRDQARVQQARTNINQPVRNTPPVTFRGGMAGVPVHQRTQGKVRRQYYYALGTTGAEVRLPAMPQIEIGWRLASGTLVVALLACLITLWNAPFFQISQAKVKGAERVTVEEIYAALDVNGMPVVEASPAKMKAALEEAFPEFSSISVSVGLPASVTVTVQERQPVMVWEQGETSQWIDAAGFAFPIRGSVEENLITVSADSAPAAVATTADTAETTTDAEASSEENSDTQEEAEVIEENNTPAPFLSADLINSIEDMSAFAPAGTKIAYSNRYGLGWNDTQGWKVYFGTDLGNLDLKMKEYDAIVASLTGQGIQPSLISLEFLDAPFYRLEP